MGCSRIFASSHFSFMPHLKLSVLSLFPLAWHTKIKSREALPSLSPMLLRGARVDRTPHQAWLDHVEDEGKPPSSTRSSLVVNEGNSPSSIHFGWVESEGNSSSSTRFSGVGSEGNLSSSTRFDRVGSEGNPYSSTRFGRVESEGILSSSTRFSRVKKWGKPLLFHSVWLGRESGNSLLFYLV